MDQSSESILFPLVHKYIERYRVYLIPHDSCAKGCGDAAGPELHALEGSTAVESGWVWHLPAELVQAVCGQGHLFMS